VAEALGDWMKQLGQRTDKRGDQLGPRIYTEPDFALARLRHEKAVLYARAGEFGGSRPEKVAEELDGWERALDRLDRHKSRPVQHGLSEHAYLSMIDDSPQPYYLHVPRGHDGRTRLPLIVYLHGYSPDLNKLNWGMIPRDLLHYCDDHGYYLVAPFGRSNTDFQGIGEADVLRVLMRVNKLLPVRADRVFLFGYSMGGMGVFTIGAHHPDLWAGIVSVSGRADYYLWHELDREKVEPYKRHLIDREFGAEMLGNFKSLPVLMYHGGGDSLVKVEQPRRMKRKLDALEADVTLNILPGRDHWIMSRVLADDTVFDWMNRQRRDPWPRRIDFKTYSIQYRSAHWVTILELERWGRPARVRATLNAEKTAMAVTTTNVASIRLDLGKHLVGDKPDLTVRIDGKEHRVTEPGPRTFDLADREHAGELRKTPRVCGPAKQVYARRFLMVFGAGEAKKADVERLRSEVQSAAAEWYQFAKSIPLRKLGVQVTEDDIEQANLILYGTPGRNKVLKRVADRLPIRITDDGFTFQGKTYDNQTHGLVMVYPNPLNPDRLLMVRSGLPYGEALPPNHKYDLLPDFVIFKEGTDYDDTDRAVVAGFFDRDWQVSDPLIWRRGDRAPDPRLHPEPQPVERRPIGVP
ncbi:MAG: prolyl oligopeptidase family serine peptidase, partial [Planctomycetota bacterium]